jgi:hypothetical protein
MNMNSTLQESEAPRHVAEIALEETVVYGEPETRLPAGYNDAAEESHFPNIEPSFWNEGFDDLDDFA